MVDFSHLDAIQARIAREEQRLAQARTPHEKAFREREIAAARKEEAAEYLFLGIDPAPASLDELLASDDALLLEMLAS